MTFRRILLLAPIALLIAACAAPGATNRPSTAVTAAPTTAVTVAPATATAAPTNAATPTPAVATPSATPIELSTPSPVADACAGDLPLKHPGRLTLSTDIPAFPPWWGGSAPEQYDNEPEGGSPWSETDFSAEPYSGEGFEGALAYAVAEAMGFSADEVDWLANPEFSLAFAPGAKDFDFHMAQISATSDRAQAVTFSEPYFDSNQAVIALTSNEIVGAASIEDLKAYRLGAAANTTSFTFLEDTIAPDVEPQVFTDNAGTLQALKGDVVDAIIVDLSTAFYMRDGQLGGDPAGTIVGQFGPPAEPDHVAYVLELDNPLVDCVNQALAEVRESGQHQEILDEWINTGQSVPFLE